MISKFKTFSKYVALGVGLTVAPFLASADAISTSTVSDTIISAVTDVSVVLGAIVGSIIGVSISLLLLNWGYSRVKKHITGRRKF